MQRWARREKQLQAAAALVGVAGDVQGLAIQDLKMLELEEPFPRPNASRRFGECKDEGAFQRDT